MVKNIKEEEDRTAVFWGEIDRIIKLLNETDPTNSNTTINSPQVNQYLLWRILEELKLLKLPRKKER